MLHCIAEAWRLIAMRKIRHNYPQDARIYEIHNFRVAQLVVVAVTAAAAVAVCLLPMSLPLVFLL